MAEATAKRKLAKKAAPKKAVKSAPKTAPEAPKKAPEGSKTGFAVIMTGGKQYRVMTGQRLKIEKLPGDNREGDTVVFKEVLLRGDDANLDIGMPHVSTGKVEATITKIGRYKTVDVIHYKQKSRYFKKYGHRQPFFEVRIDSIS